MMNRYGKWIFCIIGLNFFLSMHSVAADGSGEKKDGSAEAKKTTSEENDPLKKVDFHKICLLLDQGRKSKALDDGVAALRRACGSGEAASFSLVTVSDKKEADAAANGFFVSFTLARSSEVDTRKFVDDFPITQYSGACVIMRSNGTGWEKFFSGDADLYDFAKSAGEAPQSLSLSSQMVSLLLQQVLPVKVTVKAKGEDVQLSGTVTNNLPWTLQEISLTAPFVRYIPMVCPKVFPAASNVPAGEKATIKITVPAQEVLPLSVGKVGSSRKREGEIKTSYDWKRAYPAAVMCAEMTGGK